MSILSGYAQPILTACLLFLPIAALITLPFMILQYRRYGSIPVLRVAIVYSFVLYMLCAFLLTVLPLPSRHEVAQAAAKPIQYIPFSTYVAAFEKAGLTLSDPSTLLSLTAWKRLLRSGLFEILANIVMQVPLGIYLRYYFRCDWKRTLLIGFCVTLFYELTQLTGLFFIYPKAYRVASVDDLIDNTLGCMLGYLITPLLSALLPTREELDRTAIAHARRATVMRRVTAAIVDWLLCGAVTLLLWRLGVAPKRLLTGMLLWAFVLYVGVQYLTGGCTLGKRLLRLRVTNVRTGGRPAFLQLLGRYALIYMAVPILLLSFLGLSLLVLAALLSDAGVYNFVGIVGGFAVAGGSAWALLHILRRHGELPHSYLTHTRIVVVPRRRERRDA